MIPYASRTGSGRNLAQLRRYGWRLMVSAAGVHRTEGFPYAIDNGAWTAYVQKQAWDPSAFVDLVDEHGAGSDFIVAPDIVDGGAESLKLSREWLLRLDGIGARRLIAVQDGMRPEQIAPLIGARVGIFVGGTTAWKLRTMASWATLARACCAYIHVGRVNTGKRIAMCTLARVDSFDGTSASRFSVTVPALDAARRQSAWVF